MATRKYSEACLNKIAPVVTELIGGSADLTHSNLTELKESGEFQKDTHTKTVMSTSGYGNTQWAQSVTVWHYTVRA